MLGFINAVHHQTLVRRLLVDVPENADKVVHGKSSDVRQFIQRNARVEILVDHCPREADAVDIGVKVS